MIYASSTIVRRKNDELVVWPGCHGNTRLFRLIYVQPHVKTQYQHEYLETKPLLVHQRWDTSYLPFELGRHVLRRSCLGPTPQTSSAKRIIVVMASDNVGSTWRAKIRPVTSRLSKESQPARDTPGCNVSQTTATEV